MIIKSLRFEEPMTKYIQIPKAIWFYIAITGESLKKETLRDTSNSQPQPQSQLLSQSQQSNNILKPLEKNVFILPMAFARDLKGLKMPNLDIQHTPMHTSAQFVGSLREYQVEVFEKAKFLLESNGTLIMNLYTGFGKTILAFAISAYFKLRTLCILPMTGVITSWLEEGKNRTNFRIYEIKGGEKSLPDADFYIGMMTACKNLPHHEKIKFGIIIVDEADLFCTPDHYEVLLHFQPKYAIALSATIKRDDGMEKVLFASFGINIIRRISEKPFYVYKHNTPYKAKPKMKPGQQRRPGWTEYLKSIAENENFNRDILNWVIMNPNNKIGILADTTEQVDLLANSLRAYGDEVSTVYKKGKVFDDARVVIGTSKKMGIGFDDKNALQNHNGIRFEILIIATDCKKIEQKKGRSRADLPIIIDFVHDSKTFREHWDFREEWYKSRKGTIIPVNQPFNLIPTLEPYKIRSEKSRAECALKESEEKKESQKLQQKVYEENQLQQQKQYHEYLNSLQAPTLNISKEIVPVFNICTT
jgi:hypothetical protein